MEILHVQSRFCLLIGRNNTLNWTFSSAMLDMHN